MFILYFPGKEKLFLSSKQNLRSNILLIRSYLLVIYELRYLLNFCKEISDGVLALS